jgi:hypothetical protein
VAESKPPTKVDELVERTGMARPIVLRLVTFCGTQNRRPETVLNDAVDQYLRALGA